MKKITSILLMLAMVFGILTNVQAEEVQPFIIQPHYDDVTIFQEGRAFVKVGGKWGVIDNTGKVIAEPQYDDVYFLPYMFKNGLSKVSKDGKWGFIDQTGKEVIPLKYDWEPGDFHEGLAAVYVDNAGWGFVDQTGKEVIKPQYSEVSDFNEGVAPVVEYAESRTIGFIDKTGKKIAQTPYYIPVDLSPSGIYADSLVNEGLYWVAKNNGDEVDYFSFNTAKFGAIDNTGKVVVDFLYDVPTTQLDNEDKGNRRYMFSEGVAIVGEDFKRVFVDTSGKEIVKLSQYDGREDFYASNLKDGMLAIQIGSYPDYQWGFIDKTGKEIVQPQYDDAKDFTEGLAAVKKNGKYGFINKSGQVVIHLQYEDAVGFQDGLAWVKQGGKWGAIDASGKMIIQPQYDNWYTSDGLAYVFSDGLSFVKKGEKFGYIDKTGKDVIPLQFDNAWYFNEGLAPVQVNGKWGYIAKPLDKPTEEIQYPLHDYKDLGTHIDIQNDKIWTITFNHSVRSDTVNDQSIYVLDSLGERIDVDLELSEDGEFVKVLPPQSMYKSGQTYYLLVRNSVYSVNDKMLNQPVSIQFTIE